MTPYSVALSLIHSCTIQRDPNADTPDAWGTPSSPDWQDHLTDVPCKFWTQSGMEQTTSETWVVDEASRLIFPLGTDVTERDRIGDVSYRGTVIVPGPTSIRAVVYRADHLELFLVRISGG